MKTLFATFVLTILSASCGVFDSLNSNTSIKPNDSFVLGNNEHGSFTVKLKNVSKNDIDIYKAPISGGTHSRITIKPNIKTIVKVDRNTALVIENKSTDYASVDLKVTGDLGLSMTYKNQ
ncbi:hypothetical protein SAMN05444372_101329 [Flavobacterium micromati]|uniref:Lipoprotein n=1 Tax=Flavobacterium micromati TaxID=229205 RepID=A0A1M5FWK5_9FLAO|nr:hypothetical protein [Flavobacterium micromati]SHF95774.1 hypothetical protein SAMN05444372_101329 [Flavobacterium micromati]